MVIVVLLGVILAVGVVTSTDAVPAPYSAPHPGIEPAPNLMGPLAKAISPLLMHARDVIGVKSHDTPEGIEPEPCTFWLSSPAATMRSAGAGRPWPQPHPKTYRRTARRMRRTTKKTKTGCPPEKDGGLNTGAFAVYMIEQLLA